MSTGEIPGAKKGQTLWKVFVSTREWWDDWQESFIFQEQFIIKHFFPSPVIGLITSGGSRCQNTFTPMQLMTLPHTPFSEITGRQSRTKHYKVSETLGRHIEITVINSLRIKSSCNLFKWTDVSTVLRLLLCLMLLDALKDYHKRH